MAASKAQELPITESHILAQGQTLFTLPHPNKDSLCVTPHPLRAELNSPGINPPRKEQDIQA
jgi:hypothetical protein